MRLSLKRLKSDTVSGLAADKLSVTMTGLKGDGGDSFQDQR